ncbi:mlr0127 [Mesorhizobium japonicum MAFF 303099]|uniref:Mlr0127 protein n=1 Tax=Mesorhizobium japonicum (strain LMG 29417 / CECT 9101 / MAFF 303099) TaxID=266835 RepID=Q98NI4_RHILO|nr:mlr0127 [Mesorhizobium japonicum MAFF 303099]
MLGWVGSDIGELVDDVGVVVGFVTHGRFPVVIFQTFPFDPIRRQIVPISLRRVNGRPTAHPTGPTALSWMTATRFVEGGKSQNRGK